MRQLTLSETADFLETATIERTHDAGHAIVHVGTGENGLFFVLMNNMHGQTCLTESM